MGVNCMDGQQTRPLVYAGSYTACCERGGPWRVLSTNYYFSLGLTHGKFWGNWYVVPFKTVPTILFGDIRNSVHEKSHEIPRNSAEFHGIIRHGIRRNSAGILANSARNME
jgi:hypothetical protein